MTTFARKVNSKKVNNNLLNAQQITPQQCKMIKGGDGQTADGIIVQDVVVH